MSLPDWRTSTAGAMKRTALWLHTEVRVGGVFTKAHLRDAFPGVQQIDRRMRDLRPEGWVIATSQEDPSLEMEELRLVSEGGRVWEKGYRSKAAAAVTDKTRSAVLAAGGYACAYCGISGGEAYADDPIRTAKLVAARIASADGEPAQMVAACDRCRAGIRDQPPVSAQELLEQADALDQSQRARLLRWARRGARQQAPEELLWARYRRAPSAAREALEEHLAHDS